MSHLRYEVRMFYLDVNKEPEIQTYSSPIGAILRAYKISNMKKNEKYRDIEVVDSLTSMQLARFTPVWMFPK